MGGNQGENKIVAKSHTNTTLPDMEYSPVMCPSPGPVLEYARQLFYQRPASVPINLFSFPLTFHCV